MTSNSETADSLRAAADYIRVHGWHQGSTMNPDTGAVCAYGAILGSAYEASGYEMFAPGSPPVQDYRRVSDPAVVALNQWLMTVYPAVRVVENGGIPWWNDVKDRTVDDVTAGLEKAAAWIEEQV